METWVSLSYQWSTTSQLRLNEWLQKSVSALVEKKLQETSRKLAVVLKQRTRACLSQGNSLGFVKLVSIISLKKVYGSNVCLSWAEGTGQQHTRLNPGSFVQIILLGNYHLKEYGVPWFKVITTFKGISLIKRRDSSCYCLNSSFQTFASIGYLAKLGAKKPLEITVSDQVFVMHLCLEGEGALALPLQLWLQTSFKDLAGLKWRGLYYLRVRPQLPLTKYS